MLLISLQLYSDIEPPIAPIYTRVWKHVVQKGDTVIDATCGNGYDTLAMLKMVADESGRGCVYAMDIQKDALVNTYSLLERSLNPNEVPLFCIFFCLLLWILPRKGKSLRVLIQETSPTNCGQ